MNELKVHFCRILRILPFLCALISTSSHAFEARLELTDQVPDLETALTNASLVFSVKEDDLGTPLDVLSAAQADYSRLIAALYDRGYFGPVISIRIDGREAAEIAPLAQLSKIDQVDIRVTPGPAFRLGTAQVGPLAPGTNAPEGFATGQSARTDVIGDTARGAVKGWRAISYAKARVDTQSVRADHANAQLDVILGIDPGPPVTFGQVHVPTDSGVRESRIRKISGIPVGKPFDPVELERAAARLRRSGAFSSVSIREADDLGPDDTLDIDLELADAKRRRFGVGAELHSVEGTTLSGFWLHRNLFGGAERLRIEAEFAGLGGETDGIDSTLRFSFTRPATFGSDTDLFVLAEIEQLDEPLFFARQTNLVVGVSHFFSDQLEGRVGLAYRFSDVEDDFGDRVFNHVALPFSITWDTRDDKLDATKGFFLSGEGLPYFGVNGSASGARAFVDARGYQGLGDSGVVLAGRFQVGSIVGSSVANTPSDLLFLSGGSDTVRGQSFQSLFVTTGAAESGGRSFLGFMGEARFPVTKNFGGVAFYDIGYVGENSFLDDTGDVHSGAGIGVRYKTGIGPIRFDLAVPVSGRDTSGFEFYLGIGQAF